MTEFFSLPEKFLFFEIKDLAPSLQQLVNDTREITLIFGLDKNEPALEQQLKADWFQLGCTPVVNLFKESLRPFHLTSSKKQYLLSSEIGEPNAEIYFVENLVGKKDAQLHHYLPIYGLAPKMFKTGEHSGYYRIHNKPSWYGDHYYPKETETYLDIVDTDLECIQDETIALHIDTLCLNRSLPENLLPELLLIRKEEKVKSIKQLVPFTRCRWPKTTQYNAWHILSHLKSSFLSVLKDIEDDDTDTALALREMLRLYDLDSSREHDWIDGILHIQRKKSTAIKIVYTPRPGGRRHREMSVWAGTTVTLTVDESRFTRTSLYLFGAAEERFLAGHVPRTTYTELRIINQQGTLLYAWPPRAGEEKIL